MEAPSSLIQQLLGRVEDDPRFIYTSQDLADPDLIDFITSIKGSCGVYQGLSIFVNGDTREQ